MRTIVIWQSSNGPILIDEETLTRIENCKQVDIAPIKVDVPAEATLFLWPENVRGTIQHGLEPTLERVLVKFAPLFPSVVRAYTDIIIDEETDRNILDGLRDKWGPA